MVDSPIIAVDVGNARIKFGRFSAEGGRVSGNRADSLPEPEHTLQLADVRRISNPSYEAPQLDEVGPWLETACGGQPAAWWIGSVNRPACTRLVDWLREHRPDDPVRLLAAGDLPLEVQLDRPDMVGIDRLLDAVAANHLRRPDRPAIVADVGTAITVDLVSAEGVFLGGSILPGIAMSARAMHEFTDLLPLLEMSELSAPPPALGTSTEPAMRSGLFWGAVGAIRQLIEQLGKGLDGAVDVFLTGGAGPAVAELLNASARNVPHLTLAGIALSAKQHGRSSVTH